MRGFALFCVLLSGVLSLPTGWAATREAPTILDVELRNPYVSAGDRLDIRVRAIPGSDPIMTNSGTSVYLGFIPQNLFPQSDSLNRSLTQVGPDEFEISDLVVNPYAFPNFQKYTIMTFTISDMGGRSTTLYADDEVPFYFDDQGNETRIPVMRFHLLDNPNADVIGPEIRSIRLDKSEYAPGEEIVLDLEATDDRSGVMAGYLGAVSTQPNALDSTFQILAQTGENLYRLRGFLLKDDLPDSPEEIVITYVMIADQAKNWGWLYAPSHDALFYFNVKGERTSIPVLRFNVKRRTHRAEP